MNSRAGEAGFGDDDRLPWLESVEEDYNEGPSIGRIVLLVFLGLAVLAAVVFGWYWYQQQGSVVGGGSGELINAQEGDYKVRPDEPGGMQVQGQGDVAFTTGQGDIVNGSIDVSRAPEAPVAGRTVKEERPAVDKGTAKVVAAVPPSSGRLELPKPAATTPTTARPAPAQAGGAVLQLGSFPNEAGANSAWQRLSKRFKYLAPLAKSVEKAEVAGKTVYRLRVSAGTNALAKDLCGRLKVAGESCFLAN